MQRKNNKGWKRSLLIILLIIAGLFFVTFPIPYYIEGPGSAENVDPMITIENETNDETGTYMMTTIATRRATPLTYFMDLLPFYDRYSEEELFGTMESFDEYVTLQQYLMDSSKHAAMEAAYDASDLPSELIFRGVYVMSVDPASDFLGELQPGDTIVSIDGQEFESSVEFIEEIKSKEVGDTIEVTYERADTTNQVEGELILLEETGNPGIGISLVDHTDIRTEPEAEIDAGAIGGPSAGLMFALRMYTILNDLSLSEDYQIAGTGTIDPDGNVGRIGGAGKKVVAADDAGATIFFAPDDEITPEMEAAIPNVQSNYEEARIAAEAIQSDIEVVPVKTLQDAIDYLNQLP